MESNGRKCDECTACCEGWLPGTVWGRPMYPGKNCYFLKNKACSIYEERPKYPCIKFECSWLKGSKNEFPDWLRPDKSGFIIVNRKTKTGKTYLVIVETYKKIDKDTLSWIKKFQLEWKKNIALCINEKWEYIGDQDFCKEDPLHIHKLI